MSNETKYCDGCGAMGETCCQNAKQRQETANTLAQIVDRQSREITRLQRTVLEHRQVIADLRKVGA